MQTRYYIGLDGNEPVAARFQCVGPKKVCVADSITYISSLHTLAKIG